MISDPKKSQSGENEIDLKLILNVLFKSKILIILITIFFILAAIFISSQKSQNYSSNALIKIGTYDGNLLEHPSSLIDFLNYEYIQKPNVNNIVIKNISNNGISINVNSKSFKNSFNQTNQIVESSELRHLEILNQKHGALISKMTSELNLLDSKITESLEKEIHLKNLISELKADKNNSLYLGRLEFINFQNETRQLMAQKKYLQSRLEILMNKTFRKTTLDGEIQTIKVKPRLIIYIILGFLFGLFFSIVIVLFNNNNKRQKSLFTK